jgi:hypothetical protein
METDMRPRIEGRLEERAKRHATDVGFEEPADFVRYCVAKEMDRREVLEG